MDKERIRLGRIKAAAFKEGERTPSGRDLYLSEEVARFIAHAHPDDYLDRISSLKAFLRNAVAYSYMDDGKILYLAANRPSFEGRLSTYVIKVVIGDELYVSSFGRLDERFSERLTWSSLDG